MSMAELYFPKYLTEFKATKPIDHKKHKSILIVDQTEYPFQSKHIINRNCSEDVLYKNSNKLAPVFLTSGLGGMSGRFYDVFLKKIIDKKLIIFIFNYLKRCTTKSRSYC